MTTYGTASISVATPTLMYIVIKDKALFDAINLPATNHGKVVSKTEYMGDITVIIQHWLPEAAVPEAAK